MEVYYYKDPAGNFGDDLNELIWPHVLHDVWYTASNITLVGIGSILWKGPLSDLIDNGRHPVVLGSGISYRDPPTDLTQMTILAVRGPLTASLLGKPDKSLTDAAILIGEVDGPHQHRRSDGKVLFMPHHRTLRRTPWAEIAEEAGFQYVSPQQSIEDTLNEFAGARLVVTEALHGAIVADALRIPWLPIRISPRFEEFKWLDWCLSMEVDFKPLNVLPGDASDSRNFNAIAQLLSKSGVHGLQIDSSKPLNDQIQHYVKHRFDPDLQNALLQPVPMHAFSRAYNLTRRLLDNRFRQSAIRSLTALKGEKGFLSSDAIFNTRLADMKMAVSSLKDMINY